MRVQRTTWPTQTVQCTATNHLRFSIYLTAKHFQLQREHITAVYDTLRRPTTVYSLHNVAFITCVRDIAFCPLVCLAVTQQAIDGYYFRGIFMKG